MMKRFALAAVVALSLLSLTACSGEEKKEETTPSPAASVEAVTPSTAGSESVPASTQAGTDSMAPIGTESIPAATH